MMHLLSLLSIMVASCSAFQPPLVDSNPLEPHKLVLNGAMSSAPASTEKQPRSSLEWMNDNVLILESKFPSKTLFKHLIPLQPGNGREVKVRYQCPTEGAKELVEQLKPRMHRDAMTEMLESSLTDFAQIAKPYESKDGLSFFEAKLISSRGKSGTKCSRWHFDNVPVRWIQALVGPGCDFVLGEAGVNRNEKDWFKPREKNGKCNRVDETVADVRRCTNGEATVLKGLLGSTTTMKPAIHKSPTMKLMEGRVLLVIDIVTNDSKSSEQSCSCPFDH
jgi:hypothetical protein